ncbi:MULTISPECIES: hypothetical protein [Streptomyces]|uniref:hypothetical protein n=1 Tax=Streptomyces TaxID=1883 RepID=UPI001AD7EA38|nr:hypothetical protein [Streptomyces melanosporofaciens]
MITSVRTALAAAPVPLTTSPATAEQPGGDGTVDFGQRLQPIDGFGFSQAFQRADVMHGAQGLTPQHQREVLDLLLAGGRRGARSTGRMTPMRSAGSGPRGCATDGWRSSCRGVR